MIPRRSQVLIRTLQSFTNEDFSKFCTEVPVVLPIPALQPSAMVPTDTYMSDVVEIASVDGLPRTA